MGRYFRYGRTSKSLFVVAHKSIYLIEFGARSNNRIFVIRLIGNKRRPHNTRIRWRKREYVHNVRNGLTCLFFGKVTMMGERVIGLVQG